VKWSICIRTVVDRPDKFKRLVDCLAPQVANYNGDIEVVVLWNNYEHELSELRQLMLEDARGEYINFIDDDDLVAEDYVETIYPLLDGVDYIGFKLDFYSGTTLQKPTIHSIKNPGWEDGGAAYLRRGTLVNPTKRNLMLKAGFKGSDYRKGIPEDITYADAIDKLLKTENFIDKTMHFYYQTGNHAWSNFTPRDEKFVRPELPKYFRFHPESTK